MKNTSPKTGLILLGLALFTSSYSSVTHADIAWFDDTPLAPGGFYDGADGAGGFNDGGVHFNNNNPGGFWSGFAVSQVNDTTTPGFGNQYATYSPGTGQGGSGNYGVVFADPNGFGITPTATFRRPSLVQGMYINNATYTALSMLNGDMFAKKFGGVTGSDEDWLLLTITGKDAFGISQGAVDFYLADYRFSDNSADYVVDDWSWINLSGLGNNVSQLEFALDSTDRGMFGVNTPAYFTIDGISAIPEPGTASLLLLSTLVLAGKWWIARKKS